MKRIVLMAAALAVLASCAPPPPPPPPIQPAPPPPPPQATLPVVPDMCGASELQHLVGQPKTQIPVPIDPSRRRVACTTCPVTMDYRPDRLNFFFDPDTGIIKEIKCG